MKRYGWKPDFPDHRDRLYRAIKPHLALPMVVDLRPKDSPVENQGNLGSCTANALAGAVQFNELKFGEPFAYMSRLFIYFNEREIEGTISQDAGAMIRDGIKTLSKQGVCAETLWPYDEDAFTKRPTDIAYKAAKERIVESYHRLITLDDMLACLADGYPFVFGISVYESFESQEVARTGLVPMPGPDEQMIGGHALCCVGYDQNEEHFIVRNSWGADWGMSGYCYLPFEYMRTLADDLWTVRK